MDGQEVKLLGLFYLSSFLSTALNATEAIWVVFLMAKSFTFTQIGLNFAIFAFGRFIFEVPTGAFADAYGRKFSVILGWILEGAAFITFPFLHSFSTWLVVVFVSSIGYTMISGAQDAWAIDYLKKKNASVLSKNYFAHTEAIRNIAFAVAGLIGAALLTYFSMVSIFYAFTLGCILTAIILSFQKEYFAPKKLQIVELMKNSVRKSKQGINVS